MWCNRRAQKQIAELEAEIEALEEELETATAANKEASQNKAAADELRAEIASLKDKVRHLQMFVLPPTPDRAQCVSLNRLQPCADFSQDSYLLNFDIQQQDLLVRRCHALWDTDSQRGLGIQMFILCDY